MQESGREHLGLRPVCFTCCRALLSSEDADHLDIEPRQHWENKAAGNLRFLPGLVDAYRAVRQIAGPAQLTVSADIQNKLLKGDLGQRQLLWSSRPSLTLMLYAVSGANDARASRRKSKQFRP